MSIWKTIVRIKKLRKLFPQYLDYFETICKEKGAWVYFENQTFLLKTNLEILKEQERLSSRLKEIEEKLNLSQKRANVAASSLRNMEENQDFLLKEIQLNHRKQEQLFLEGKDLEEKVFQALKSNEKLLEDKSGRLEDLFKNSRIPQDLPGRLFSDPELELMGHLSAFLSSQIAFDVGANIGNTSSNLLARGYSVFAFEPHPQALARLRARFCENPNFVAFPYGIGSSNFECDLHLVTLDEEKIKDYKYVQDPTAYSSFIKHSLPPAMKFKNSITVPIRSLNSLCESKEIPSKIGLLKIDTEGFELEVIKGMSSLDSECVVTEFWDEKFVLSSPDCGNGLSKLVHEMKSKGYPYFIVLFQEEMNHECRFFYNWNSSPSQSWGNVFFFKKSSLFAEALRWCEMSLPRWVAL